MTIRTLAAAGLLAAALGMCGVAVAQEQAPPPSHGARYMHRFDDLNLSDQQRSQIQSAIQQYRAGHPKGSQPDPQARKALRDQVMSALTPDQRTTLIRDQQARRRAKKAADDAQPSPQP